MLDIPETSDGVPGGNISGYEYVIKASAGFDSGALFVINYLLGFVANPV